MRILVLIVIGLLLYIIINNLLRNSRRPSSDNVSSEKMVRCSYCNLHLLEQEAIKHGSNYFCSQEHQDLHK